MSRITTIAILLLSLLSCSEQSPSQKNHPEQRKHPQAPAVQEEPSDSDPAATIDTDSATSIPAPSPTPSSGKPMLLDFTKDHCMPCTIMAPWVEQLRTKYAEHVDVSEINIDRPGNNELGIYFKVASIPTQVYVDRNGVVMSRHVGLATRAQMEGTLKKHGFIGETDHAPPGGKKSRE